MKYELLSQVLLSRGGMAAQYQLSPADVRDEAMFAPSSPADFRAKESPMACVASAGVAIPIP
jgi:hypothetical protein